MQLLLREIVHFDNLNYNHHHQHPSLKLSMSTPQPHEEHLNLWTRAIDPEFKDDSVEVNGNRVDLFIESRGFKSQSSKFIINSTNFLISGHAARMPQVNVMVHGEPALGNIRA